MSASLADFSDRGIILAIEDNIGQDGFADIQDIAEALGMTSLKGLGSRLSWMRRYGMVVRHHSKVPSRWRVSNPGEKAYRKAEGTILSIERSAKIEFELLRRSVEYRRRR